MSRRIEGERIYLRPMAAEDLDAVHSYASLAVVSEHQPWGPNSWEETKSYIEDVLMDAAELPQIRFVFAIVLKETEAMIGAGEIWFHNYDNLAGEIGYVLHPDHWGKGLATETAELLLKFGFEEKRLHRIQATCSPDNTNSKKLLEKLGMVPEGKIRDALRLKNGWRDSLLYSILEDEWRGGKGKT
jgi:RimJ/RimL family protein N-acetyltransferase